jgi:hypothetical protein
VSQRSALIDLSGLWNECDLQDFAFGNEINMSFKAFVVASLLLTSLSSEVRGQSPRFTLDLGEGNEKVSANAYSARNKPYFSAVGSFRVGEFHGVGVQVIATQTRVGNGEHRTEATCPIDFASNTPSASLCDSPLELSGNRSSIGLGVERALFPLLSIRAGASIGWFDAQTSVGSGSRAFPLFAEAIVPLTSHLAAIATIEEMYLRDLGGSNVVARANWYGLRLY